SLVGRYVRLRAHGSWSGAPKYEGALPSHCRSGVSRAVSAAPFSAEAGCSRSVTMYNAWWCPYCRKVRAILARNHIRYNILDATSPQVKASMLRRFGDTAVPRTVTCAAYGASSTRAFFAATVVVALLVKLAAFSGADALNPATRPIVPAYADTNRLGKNIVGVKRGDCKRDARECDNKKNTFPHWGALTYGWSVYFVVAPFGKS